MACYPIVLDSTDRSSGSLSSPVFNFTRAIFEPKTKIALHNIVIPRIKNITSDNKSCEIDSVSINLAEGFYEELTDVLTALSDASSGSTITYDTVSGKVTITRAGTFDMSGKLLTALGFVTPLTGSASYTAGSIPAIRINHDYLCVRIQELGTVEGHAVEFGGSQPVNTHWVIPCVESTSIYSTIYEAKFPLWRQVVCGVPIRPTKITVEILDEDGEVLPIDSRCVVTLEIKEP